ncbi:MAG: biotin--[acetyl-CoA-carboxylase] ligase [Elusimicrobiota bacterium]|jgi:BirA family biotin operon repressor/biotin-[acetyl-CoA-carboxylase] ligase|nr:biotin--[acetyl-CoA-carboxylase] ligase [Elusimicrobiota bacterium]
MDLDFTINKIIELGEVSSTQDIAKELATVSDYDYVLICAKTQTNGRGRYERKWDSCPGGLYMSLLLRSKKQISSTSDLSVKTGQAVAQTLKELYGIKTKIKLPNDVLAVDKTGCKKISGILIETSSKSDKLNWLSVGIGVNLNNKPSKNLQAISAKEILGKAVDINEFRGEFIKIFALKYLQWQIGSQN